jgi:hypothetical protein
VTKSGNFLNSFSNSKNIMLTLSLLSAATFVAQAYAAPVEALQPQLLPRYYYGDNDNTVNTILIVRIVVGIVIFLLLLGCGIWGNQRRLRRQRVRLQNGMVAATNIQTENNTKPNGQPMGAPTPMTAMAVSQLPPPPYVKEERNDTLVNELDSISSNANQGQNQPRGQSSSSTPAEAGGSQLPTPPAAAATPSRLIRREGDANSAELAGSKSTTRTGKTPLIKYDQSW